MPKKTRSPIKDGEDLSVAVAADAAAPMEKGLRRASARTKKPPAKKGVKRPKTKAPITPLPTDEEIRIRAYFISERRHRLALPGNATSDWEEARRQLLSEAGPG